MSGSRTPAPHELSRESSVLIGMLREWLALTQSETEAILREDWRSLDVAQSAKSRLMGRLQEFGPVSPEQRSLSSDLVSRISGQEASNRDLLGGKMDRSRTEMQGLGSSARQLRQIQTAYRGGTAPGWQWYS